MGVARKLAVNTGASGNTEVFNMATLFLVIFIQLLSTQFSYQSDCKVNPDADLGKESPLLLLQTRPPSFPYPNSTSGALIIKKGKRVLLACAQSKSELKCGNTRLSQGEVVATCQKDTSFSIDGTSCDLKEVKCQTTPSSSVVSGGTCYRGQFKKLRIGYQLPSSGFVALVDVCYDQDTFRTLYVNHTVSRAAEYRQREERNNYFSVSGFDPKGRIKDKQQIYACNHTNDMFQLILGSKTLAKRNHDCGDVKDLVRGHLAPNADFVYFPQQKATFYYVNVAPQWSGLNGANWKSLETKIRQKALALNSDLVVFSGTHGVLQIANTKGVKKDIYLAEGPRNEKGLVPVPALFWKLVYDPRSKKATVFVAVNKVPPNSIEDEDRACANDACPAKSNFLPDMQHRRNITKGYMYCCSVGDFNATTGALRDFRYRVTGLLE